MSIIISYYENIPSAVVLALGNKAVLYCKSNFSDNVFSTVSFVAAAAVAVVSFGQIFRGGFKFCCLVWVKPTVARGLEALCTQSCPCIHQSLELRSCVSESRDCCPGLSVPNGPYGLCGSKATLNSVGLQRSGAV